MTYHRKSVLVISLLCLSLTACFSTRPANITNVCDIFEDRRGWYKAAKKSEQRWGVPIPVSMAFIYQESSFKSRAKPPRSKFLWIFPGPRPSSAFGYAQALDSTWDDYKRSSGNRGARRSKFADAIDFTGWYNANSTRQSGIARDDAANLYLAYHEGNGGYQRGSYREKAWLIDAANAVQRNADRFANQYSSCKRDLDKNWLMRLFS